MLAKILSEATGIPESEFTHDYDLKESAGIDSLSWWDVICRIEDAYEIDLGDSMPECRTVGELQEVIHKLRGNLHE